MTFLEKFTSFMPDHRIDRDTITVLMLLTIIHILKCFLAKKLS